MATAPEKAGGANDAGIRADLEADIRQLRKDIAALTQQIAKTGQHSYGAARRVAENSVDQLRVQGEAAVEGIKQNARDMEDQLALTVREKPITSLMLALGAGYLLAMLSRR